MTGWGEFVRAFRRRNGLSQKRMGDLVGVSQRTISRWERGDDNPSVVQQKRLRDLGWDPPGVLVRTLSNAVTNCPAPRALSRGSRLQLLALSAPALQKRPSIIDQVGCELAPLATGILEEMLDDSILQRAIVKGEIAGVVYTSRSVLATVEAPKIRTYRTTVSYFFEDGTIYSDAISAPIPAQSRHGYVPIPMDGDVTALGDPAQALKANSAALDRMKSVGKLK